MFILNHMFICGSILLTFVGILFYMVSFWLHISHYSIKGKNYRKSGLHIRRRQLRFCSKFKVEIFGKLAHGCFRVEGFTLLLKLIFILKMWKN